MRTFRSLSDFELHFQFLRLNVQYISPRSGVGFHRPQEVYSCICIYTGPLLRRRCSTSFAGRTQCRSAAAAARRCCLGPSTVPRRARAASGGLTVHHARRRRLAPLDTRRSTRRSLCAATSLSLLRGGRGVRLRGGLDQRQRRALNPAFKPANAVLHGAQPGRVDRDDLALPAITA